MFPRAPITRSGMLDVGAGHEIFWEESGNPAGIPAVYLHGGPGGGRGPGGYRAKLDPERFRIIGFDQRGCGQSRPLANTPGYDLAQNTTSFLIADLEHLREHLGIESWLLNSVSWGSTLALAYAQEHPHRVLGIVLMAVTTTREFEVTWITESVGALFPEAWDRLATHAEKADPGFARGRFPLLEAYARLTRSTDEHVRDSAALAWAEWEDNHISLLEGEVRRDPRWESTDFRQVFATLVTHYWSNHGFLNPPILNRMDRLHGIPGVLIHGRQDVSCPLATAWELHKRWPGSTLIVEEREGHGGPEMVKAWATANSTIADALEKNGSREA